MTCRTIGWLIACGVLAAGLGLLSGCDRSAAASVPEPGMKMLVIGFDGLDPDLVKQWIAEGKLPNFKKLYERGTFDDLATAMPPQSPVAWSDFISGGHAGVHQIYDFIHRRVTTEGLNAEPYLSTSEAVPVPKPNLLSWLPDPLRLPPPFRNWELPLSGAQQQMLRKGPQFWDWLVEHDIETSIFRLPANYPPPGITGGAPFRCLCGMGTPDLLGGYGEFTSFRSRQNRSFRQVSGGRFVKIEMVGDHGEAQFDSIDNFLKYMPKKRAEDGSFVIEHGHRVDAEPLARPKLTMDITFDRDPDDDVVLISMAGQEVLLRVGEWSPWVQFSFDTGFPGSSYVNGLLPTKIPTMVRFYVRQVHPHIDVYMTPMQIDPQNAVNAVSTPQGYWDEVSEAVGLDWTIGIPEDTSALRRKGLNEDQFLELSHKLTDARRRMWNYALDHFNNGFLFFYFGHTDQLAHIFWRDQDPDHPGLKEGEAEKYGRVIEEAYIYADQRVGEAFEKLDDDDILIILSDHGFSGFRRGLNVNNWLMQEGFLKVDPRYPVPLDDVKAVVNADWPQTNAYAIGINSIYVNLEGREQFGSVPPSRKRQVMEEIRDKLLALRDPKNGEQVVERVYFVDDYYPGADPLIAPDILVGYAHNYRGSWSTALGGYGDELLEDNLDRWSGDHCIAHYLVPGTLTTNLKLNVDDPMLRDMAPGILKCFGIDKPEKMLGRVVFDLDTPRVKISEFSKP